MADSKLPAASTGGSTTPILDAARRQLDARLAGGDGVDVGMTAESGSAPGVEEVGKLTLGKGWSVSETVRWAKDKGYAAAAYIGWRPSTK